MCRKGDNNTGTFAHSTAHINVEWCCWAKSYAQDSTIHSQHKGSLAEGHLLA